jgi:hypothetical protein
MLQRLCVSYEFDIISSLNLFFNLPNTSAVLGAGFTQPLSYIYIYIYYLLPTAVGLMPGGSVYIEMNST